MSTPPEIESAASAQPEYFSGESMRLGLSVTDDDQVVRVDISPERFVEPPDPNLVDSP